MKQQAWNSQDTEEIHSGASKQDYALLRWNSKLQKQSVSTFAREEGKLFCGLSDGVSDFGGDHVGNFYSTYTLLWDDREVCVALTSQGVRWSLSKWACISSWLPPTQSRDAFHPDQQIAITVHSLIFPFPCSSFNVFSSLLSIQKSCML